MHQLSKQNISSIEGWKEGETLDALFQLPEKVLQFGTGVLLRGLPNYFIDKANRQNIFNGRVVVVKSTVDNELDTFSKQDGLFTHFVKGVVDKQRVEDYFINSSISRVLIAKKEWEKVLACATNPEMQIIISNTTELGIVLKKEDRINDNPPASFPGKLLSFLHQRYMIFNGDRSKGMVILPTELIGENGTILKEIVLELAILNELENDFIDWIIGANYFCNTLVDRIVPGKPSDEEQRKEEELLGYSDELMLMSEPYSLWAIEADEIKIKEILSFASVDEAIVLESDITKFRNLKLYLLNSTHSLCCALSHLLGFVTVTQAMQDESILKFIHSLMQEEIAPCLVGENISLDEVLAYARRVEERFENPFVEHKWLSISLNYTQKMKMRTVPLLLIYKEKFEQVPKCMALGFAAYLLFMKSTLYDDGNYYGQQNGKKYLIQDEYASYFSNLWHENDIEFVVKSSLANEALWGSDLSTLRGFVDILIDYVTVLEKISGDNQDLYQFF
jgi:tagaturonate reductase